MHSGPMGALLGRETPGLGQGEEGRDAQGIKEEKGVFGEGRSGRPHTPEHPGRGMSWERRDVMGKINHSLS